MRTLASLSCALIMAGCASGDDAASTPETVNPETMDPASDPAMPDGTAAPAPGPIATPGAPSTPTPTPPSQAALPAPTITIGGATTANVTTQLADGGIDIHGSSDATSYALINYPIATGAMLATAEFTVTPEAGAAFGYALNGGGGGYSSRLLRLERRPGSDNLFAATPAGKIACGPLPSGQPTAVTLAFDGTTHTFDILLDGAPSACMNLDTAVVGPVSGFRLTEASNAGWGGHVVFADLALLY